MELCKRKVGHIERMKSKVFGKTVYLCEMEGQNKVGFLEDGKIG